MAGGVVDPAEDGEVIGDRRAVVHLARGDHMPAALERIYRALVNENTRLRRAATAPARAPRLRPPAIPALPRQGTFSGTDILRALAPQPFTRGVAGFTRAARPLRERRAARELHGP